MPTEYADQRAHDVAWMTAEARNALITSIPAGHLECRRCGRVCEPWSLARSARCAPARWAQCIAPVEDCRVVLDR